MFGLMDMIFVIAIVVIAVAMGVALLIMKKSLAELREEIAKKEKNIYGLSKYVYLHSYDHNKELQNCGLSSEDTYKVVCEIEQKEGY